MLFKSLQEKWADVLDMPELPKIEGRQRRAVTAALLENTEKVVSTDFTPDAMRGVTLLGEAAPVNATGAGISNYDPVMIPLVRRMAPNLVAYDMVGIQPMTGPTGLVFAKRSRYSNQTGAEAFYNEANTGFSTITAGNTTPGQAANNVGTLPTGNSTTYNWAGGMTTAQAEALGTSGNTAWPEFSFSIEKVTVQANSRKLRAQWTLEVAQDLKAIHGLDAEAELANDLQTEVLSEINREIVRTINLTAVTGAQENVANTGFYNLDTDSNGRWSAERFKGMHFQIERERNVIAKQTRRGRGNLLICSSDVASALQMAGALDYAPAMAQNLNVDDTGSTFVGVLSGGTKVFIDPYFISSNGVNYMTIGYKGASAFDAGLFYCPYVPLQMVRAVDPNSYVPSIGFQTRYGIVANPYAQGTTAGLGAITQNSNVYYRRVIVTNLA